MFRNKTLFYSLSVCLGIIFILSISSAVTFAEEKLPPDGSPQGPEIFVQLGHSGGVNTVEMSKDGKYLLSFSQSGEVKLWDVQSGRESRTFPGHKTHFFGSVALSPDGRHVVSFDPDPGREEGIIKLWDIQSGHEIYNITKKGRLLNMTISFISNGKYFMIKDSISASVHIWETATGRETGGLDTQDAFVPVIVSPDGPFALIPPKRQFQPTTLWNLLTGKVVREFEKNISSKNSVFTQDGSRVLSYNFDNSLELWDVATGKALWSVEGGHSGFPIFISIADNGTTALTACKIDGTARIWDVATGRTMKDFSIPKGFDTIKLSSDGRKIIILGGDSKTVKIFDTLTGDKIKEFKKEGGNWFEDISFTPDGDRLLLHVRRATGFGRIILWDIPTDREVQRFEGSGKIITSVTFAPHRNFAAIVSGKEVSIWDVATGKRVMVLKGHQQIVSSTAFSPTTDTIVTGSLDNTLRLWDLKTGKERLSMPGHIGGVNSVAYSPDGRLVASAGNDALIKIWNGRTGAQLKSLNGHINGKGSNVNKTITGVYVVAFSLDGKKLVSAGTDGIIKLWDTATGKELKSLRGHDKDVTAVAFSPDGRFLVSGGVDGSVRRWDAKLGKELKQLNKPEYVSPVSFVGYSPDGRYIFALRNDEIVRLWRVETGQEIKQFVGIKTGLQFTDVMNSASFSSDSRYLLTNDGHGAVSRIWDIQTGKEIAQFISFTDGEWIVITPEGYFNASSDGAKHLNVRVGNNVYGIDQFYAKFYRPELVQLALAGKEMPKGELITDIAAQKPAPNVQILSPVANGSVDQDSVTVTLKITDSGGGIGNVNIYLNGAQVANDTRGVTVKGKAAVNEKILSFTIPLIAGQNEIRAVAFNSENSMESNPALINVISNAIMSKPNLYALVIGINTYKNQSISLTYAVPDAIAFAGTLKKVATPLFGKVDIRTLTTPEATTKEAITKAFEDVRQIVRPNDLFIFYDASHAVVDVVNNEEQYFLLTSNVLLLSSRHIGKDAIGQKELVQLIGNIPAQKKLVVLDTCNAGKGGKEIQVALLQQTRGLTDSTAVKLLQRAIGSAVFSASSDTQLALEGYKGHGLFTYVLLDGLRGEADIKKDGYITVLGLADYVEENVVKLSEDIFKRQQTPTIQTGANFPIGKVR